VEVLHLLQFCLGKKQCRECVPMIRCKKATVWRWVAALRGGKTEAIVVMPIGFLENLVREYPEYALF
jgi:hypothetical protein